MHPPNIDKLFVEVESVLQRNFLTTALGEFHDSGNQITRISGE